MTDAYLSLGSNVEPRLRYLKDATTQLATLGDIKAVAPLYECPPYGYTDQPPFYNTALLLKTHFPPINLLNAIKRIEIQVGRIQRMHWGPREIDIDIVFYGQLILRLPDLQIPHADYVNRSFVLQPMYDICPEFQPPDTRVSLGELRDALEDKDMLTLVKTEWTT